MFDNLNEEIINYSVIPVVVVSLIIAILLLLGKKKNDNYYQYNYSIKVLFVLMLSFVLSIMTGYTIWAYKRILSMGTASQNILYMVLLAVLVLSLFLSLIIMLVKLFKDIKKDESQEKEFQN